MKISVYMSPADYEIIKEYARLRYRSASKTMLSATMSEINRHVGKKDLRELVESYVEKYLETHFPSRGKASEGILKQVEEVL